MPNFQEKAVFIWNDATIGDAAQITRLLVEGGFEGAYLHSTNPGNWRTASRVALARALKAAGLAVYASVAVYGQSPASDGHAGAAIVNQYALDGCIFDVESGEYETAADAPARARSLFLAYQQMTAKPSAFCGWPFYKSPATGSQYHPIGVLTEAMKLADVGMPMAYPDGGDDPASVVRYLDAAWKHWREYTAKPLVMAGRAYRDIHGWPNAAAVAAYDARARALGAVGMSWWVMELALDERRVPGVWAALAKTKPFSTVVEEPVMTDYTKYAIGLYTKTATWDNKGFAFILGHAGESWNEPNKDLKPIEERANGFGQVFGVLWDFDVDFYSYKQFMADDAHWPPVAGDVPLQKAIGALGARDPKLVVVRVMTHINPSTGKPEDPGYIAYAAKIFTGRLGDWLAKNKPGAKLVIATSHDWIIANAPNMNNWVFQYPSMVVQKALMPLVENAFPQESDRVRNYLSTRTTNEFWWFYDTETVDLVLFYLGDRTKWAEWIGAAPVGDVTAPSMPANLNGLVIGTTVNLSWSPSSDGVGVTGYQVYRGEGKFMVVTGTSANIPGHLPGLYRYQVSALDGAGNESAKAEVTVIVPEPSSQMATRAELEAAETRLAAAAAALERRVAELELVRREIAEALFGK